jgi:hypothetical protein
MKLEFHPEAELELIEAAAHYELQVLGLGQRFEAEVRRAFGTYGALRRSRMDITIKYCGL